MTSPRLAGSDRAATLARWPGRCPACRESIQAGDPIARHRGKWMHEECAVTAERIARALTEEGDG